MGTWWLLGLPFIGALIGWLTNRMAIRMLFRPRRPLWILGWNFQGLLPRRQPELAEKVGEIVEAEILQQRALREEFNRLPVDLWLQQFAHRMVHQRLAPKIREMPVLGKMMNQRMVQWIEDAAQQALKKEAPALMENLVGELESRIAVRHIVQKRVAEFDLDTLERLTQTLARKEFKHIEWLGAILGFLIGCVQAGLGLLTMN